MIGFRLDLPVMEAGSGIGFRLDPLVRQQIFILTFSPMALGLNSTIIFKCKLLKKSLSVIKAILHLFLFCSMKINLQNRNTQM